MTIRAQHGATRKARAIAVVLTLAIIIVSTDAVAATKAWKRVGTVDGSSLNDKAICYWDATNELQICSSANPVISSGSVGIGTTSPRAGLDVSGTIYGNLFSGSGASLTGIGTSNLTGVTGTANSTTFLRGDNTWSAVVGVTGGFASYIPLWTGTTTIGTSSIYQSGSSIGIGTTTLSQPLTVNGNIDIYGNNNGYLTEMANSALGTTVNKLAKISANNTVTIGTTGDTDGMVGIVVGNAGTGGNAQIAIHGQAGCTFDTAPASVGNWVTISSSSAGACHDTGTKSRSAVSSQTIGLVLGTSAISGSIYPVAVNLNGAGGGGSLATLSDVTLTSPASNQMLSYNGSKWVNTAISSAVSAATAPSFSVNSSSNVQSVTSLTWTKVVLGTTVYDTDNNWSSANNRYTPTIAGKYLFTGSVYCATTSQCFSGVFKNGSQASIGAGLTVSQTNSISTTSVILDMNGTTDYVELWGQNAGGTSIGAYPNAQYFNGALLAPLASGSVAGTGTANFVPYWTSSTNLSSSPIAISSSTSSIGIGTTTIANKLDVNGKASIGYVNTAAPANGLIVSGSVGIGTASPASGVAMDVNGSIKVSATGTEVCNTSTIGQMRWNTAGGYMEMCTP